MNKTNHFILALVSVASLLGATATFASGTVGEITDVDLQKRLIEVDNITFRLLDSTTATSRQTGRTIALSKLRQGQVVLISTKNDSIVTLEILPLTDVPM